MNVGGILANACRAATCAAHCSMCTRDRVSGEGGRGLYVDVLRKVFLRCILSAADLDKGRLRGEDFGCLAVDLSAQ
jgi:hypothetical protein